MNHHEIYDSHRIVDILQQDTVFQGAIWNVQRDTFTIQSSDEPMTREYIQHPGAVAIVAINEQHQVAMVNQYRHPLRQDCWEIPAGLLDVAHEDLLATAQRELLEEADLSATHWSVLIDHYPSGGSSSEAIRIFLAQDLQPVPESQRHTRQDEEEHLVFQWVGLETLLEAVLAGSLRNTNAVAGIMAAHLVLQHGHPVRSADANW